MAENESKEYKWWEYNPSESTGIHVFIWFVGSLAMLALVYGISRTSFVTMKAQVLAPVAAASRAGTEPSSASPEDGVPGAVRSEIRETVKRLEDEKTGLVARLNECRTALEGLRIRHAAVLAEVEQLRTGYEVLAAKAAVAGDVEKKLAVVREDVKETGAELADATERLREALEKISLLEAELAAAVTERDKVRVEADAELSKKDEVIEELRSALNEYPTAPLDDGKAEEVFESYRARAETMDDIDERLEYFHKTRLLLTGTKYEAQAARMWEAARREKEAMLDKAAAEAYESVLTAIRHQPDNHEDNIRILEDTLEQVRGTRYEDAVRRLLEREERKAE